MKLHLPVRLFRAVVALMTAVPVLSYSVSTAYADMSLGAADTLKIDYVDDSTIPNVKVDDSGKLQLSGDTKLVLYNCGEGNGKTYTLYTGVTELLDKEGKELTLNENTDDISLYFDTTQPGTGFWADGYLQLGKDGTLQVILHDKDVKAFITNQTGVREYNYWHQGLEYNYYQGISFEGIVAGYSSEKHWAVMAGPTNPVCCDECNGYEANCAHGGAMYVANSITLSNNGSVKFNGNTASGFHLSPCDCCEECLSGDLSKIDDYYFHSGRLVLNGCGGAIDGLNIELRANGNVEFNGNTASSDSLSADSGGYNGYYYAACGGAINGDTIVLSDNGSVEFSGNTASSDCTARGGAIYAQIFFHDPAYPISVGRIDLHDNGSVTFCGNTASSGNSYAAGGAICGNTDLSNNGSVAFIGNTASSSSGIAYGGAIYSKDILSIRNNESVLFTKNAEIIGGNYRLRSIYVGGDDSEVSLSAPTGKQIEFQDSVYIDSGTDVRLNENYIDTEGNMYEQKGDIIFTGKYTETHLSELLDADGMNRTATSKELLNSRTSEVCAMTNLYGGRLRVEDGAVYTGRGITAHKGSAATVLVKNATLNHNDYNLTFHRGTTLAAAGTSTLKASTLNMADGSGWNFTISSQNTQTAVLDFTGSLSLDGKLTVTLSHDRSVANGGNYKLLTGVSCPNKWKEENITISSSTLDVQFEDLVWENNTLWLKDVSYAPLPEPEPEPEFKPELSDNQQETYDTILDIVDGDKPEGELGELAELITGCRNESELRDMLDAVSGSEYAVLMSSQMDGNMAHLRNLRAKIGNGMQVNDSNHLRASLEMYSYRSDVDGDAHGRGYDRTEMGGQFTLEVEGCIHMRSGISLTAGRTTLQPDAALKQHSDDKRVDVYTSYRSNGTQRGGYSGKFSVGIGTHDYELERNVLGMHTEADADGFSVNLMHESSYEMMLQPGSYMQVFGTVESSFNRIDGFRESGAGTASLEADNKDAWSTDVTLGLRYVQSFAGFALPRATLTLQGGVTGSVGDTGCDMQLRFAGARDHSYTQSAAERNRWGYNVGAALHLPISETAAFYTGGEAILRGDSNEWNANVGYQMAF